LIASGATNHYALSTAKFYGSFENVLNHELLKGMNLLQFDTAESIVETIFFTGSIVQKSAILATLDASCDLSMPELKNFQRSVAQNALRDSILQCCEFFGKGFEGNLEQYVVTIYDNYGGFSIMEWMRFFDAVTKSKFKEDYQHISVRGLNAEFINDWLEKFGEKRDDIVQSLRRELPDLTHLPSGEDVFSFETFKEIQREERSVESRVREWRTKLESELTFRRMQVLEIPTKTADGIHLEKQSVPEMVDQPNAAYKRLVNFLDVYYKPFADRTSEDAIKILMMQWDLELRYWNEGENIGDAPEKKTWYAMQAKKLLWGLTKMIEDFNKILMSAIRKLSETHTTTHALWKACGGVVDYPATDRKVEENDIRFIKEEKLMVFASYYIDRTKKRLDENIFPLYRKEFYSLCALHFYVKVAGMEHPFSPIFCVKQ